jgi:hypothetical protein
MIPALDIDPFCQAFFDDPYPAHATPARIESERRIVGSG